MQGRVVGNIYRALELAFREQLDGFTRCPACSGCGLATNTRNCFSKLNGDAQCDAEPSALYAKTTEFQDVIFFRPCPLNTAYRSVVLLIMGLLSPVFSSNSANARANSASQSPGIERVKDDDNRLKDSDNVFQMGEELGGYREPRIQKRRNHLREKAVEEAELRARSILMALVPSEP
ncbi:hypothetical protein ACLOJK_025032 [Asimina triloba]